MGTGARTHATRRDAHTTAHPIRTQHRRLCRGADGLLKYSDVATMNAIYVKKIEAVYNLYNSPEATDCSAIKTAGSVANFYANGALWTQGARGKTHARSQD